MHGLESDYATLRNAGHDDRDVFQLHLANVIVASMGAAATNVRPTVHHVDGLDLWRVHVDPCGFPVDANVVHDNNGQHVTSTEFYVRVANGTKSLDDAETQQYVKQRWSQPDGVA